MAECKKKGPNPLFMEWIFSYFSHYSVLRYVTGETTLQDGNENVMDKATQDKEKELFGKFKVSFQLPVAWKKFW